LLREFVLVPAGEASGVVVDGGAGVRDEEDALLGLGDLHEEVFGVVVGDALGEVLIGFVQLGGLVDEVEEPQRVELKQINDRLVVLKSDVMRELLQTFL
jgi:hypothetical protein